MSEKIVQLNEEVIKGQIKELVRGSVEETLNELLEQDFPASIVDEDRFFRVQVGNFETLDDAAAMEQRLKRAGYPTVIVSR